jgi:glycosyltransferase involved in cell wall biosynthesis
LEAAANRPIRLVRVISRLCFGGATIQAVSLTRLLEPRYQTTLVTGVVGAREGEMDHLTESHGVRPTILTDLRRELGPRDIRVIWELARILRRERPAILHTHTAKAGAVGRLAALLAGRARPSVIVHTFHGHVLEGYFSPLRSRVFGWVERGLARMTTKLIAVSPQVADDLVRLKIAPRERISVVRVGFDLDRFVVSDGQRATLRRELRSELSIPADRKLVTFVGRMVPIKRVDRFLAVADRIGDRRDEVHFLVVGDGELRAELEASAPALALGERITWAGFRRDLVAIYCASDVVVLTSDNEGTPVSLIEAGAAGLPVVTTDVGGTGDVVEDGVNGFLLATDDHRGMAEAVDTILSDPELAARLAAAGRANSLSRFAISRLTRDLDELYARLLDELGSRPG